MTSSNILVLKLNAATVLREFLIHCYRQVIDIDHFRTGFTIVFRIQIRTSKAQIQTVSSTGEQERKETEGTGAFERWRHSEERHTSAHC